MIIMICSLGNASLYILTRSIIGASKLPFLDLSRPLLFNKGGKLVMRCMHAQLQTHLNTYLSSPCNSCSLLLSKSLVRWGRLVAIAVLCYVKIFQKLFRSDVDVLMMMMKWWCDDGQNLASCMQDHDQKSKISRLGYKTEAYCHWLLLTLALICITSIHFMSEGDRSSSSLSHTHTHTLSLSFLLSPSIHIILADLSSYHSFPCFNACNYHPYYVSWHF